MYVALAAIVGFIVLGIVAVVALRTRSDATARTTTDAPAPTITTTTPVDVTVVVPVFNGCDFYVLDDAVPCDHSQCQQANGSQQDQIDALRRDLDALTGSVGRLRARVGRIGARLDLLWWPFPGTHSHGRYALARDAATDHTHSQYATTTEITRLNTEIQRLQNAERWSPGRLAALIGLVVGALVGVGTLSLVHSRVFSYLATPTVVRQFDAAVNHPLFQVIWVALFALVGGGVSIVVSGYFGRNRAA